MKYAFLLTALFLTACEADTKPILTYNELVHYPTDCTKARQQLEHLKYIQHYKNFDPDPDNLSEDDRAYNSRLKATIWWYAYSCDKS
jgi:hypothetical protein